MITENSTPLEIIKLNRNTEHLFNRYGIEKSNKPIYQHSISKNLNNNLLIDLLECYEDIDKIKIDKFSKYRLPLLIDYLKKSHDYYISKRIPEIEQSISILNFENETPQVTKVVKLFFREYKKDLITHFKTEENIVFPFALNLYNEVYFNKKIDSDKFEINKKKALNFLDNHTTDDSELGKLHTALLNFKLPSNYLSYFHILLNQLKNFHQDLHIHDSIEDVVLTEKIKFLLAKIESNDWRSSQQYRFTITWK